MSTSIEAAPAASTQHTPGPWTASEDRAAGGYPVRASSIPTRNCTTAERDYFTILTVATERSAHPVHGGGITDAEACANARLIAAAPELLDIMRSVADEIACYADGPRPYSGDSYLPEHFKAGIRAIIAKAEGRA